MKTFTRILVIGLLFAVIVNLAYRLELNRQPDQLVGEMMYFPSGRALRALSLGFYTPLADIVWLRFIQYYGLHRMTDLQYEYMYHILDILTTLDPYFVHAYNLGALMLTHDAGRPEEAFKLLKKIMFINPDEWRSYFMYGFINYVFLADYKTALAYLRLASQKPNATDMPKRWAGYIALKRVGDLRVSLALWQDMYENSRSPEEKKIAEMYISETMMKIDLENLNRALANYLAKYHHLPDNLKEIEQAGFIDRLPNEPHGEKYIIKDGKVESTWEIRRQKNLCFQKPSQDNK